MLPLILYKANEHSWRPYACKAQDQAVEDKCLGFVDIAHENFDVDPNMEAVYHNFCPYTVADGYTGIPKVIHDDYI